MEEKDESEKVCLKHSIQKTKSMASGPITSWQIDGETAETVIDFLFLGSRITTDGDCSCEIKTPGFMEENLRQHIKKQRHHFSDKGLYSQSYGFSSRHVWMWELDHTEDGGDAFKLWCLRRLLKSPLDCKEIKAVNPKGNQSWIFIGGTDAEVEAPILQPWREDLTHWKRPWC